jgi:hypothetical protein
MSVSPPALYPSSLQLPLSPLSIYISRHGVPEFQPQFYHLTAGTLYSQSLELCAAPSTLMIVLVVAGTVHPDTAAP